MIGRNVHKYNNRSSTLRYQFYLTMLVLILTGAHNTVAGLVTNAPAGDWSSLHQYINSRGSVNWKLFSPATAPAGQLRPLVVWLHGGAASNGQPDTLMPAPIMAATSQARYPCYILVPCAIMGRNWVSETGDRVLEAKDFPATPTASIVVVMTLIDRLLLEQPIDPQHICIGGASGGGYGTWAFLHAYPNRFEAAFPIAGGGDPDRVDKLNAVRIWMFHGGHDKLVPVSHAQIMLHALLRQQGTTVGVGESPGMWMYGTSGGHLRLTVYRNGRHDGAVIQRALTEPDFMEWLFADQHRGR